MLTQDQWTDLLCDTDPHDYPTPEAYIEELRNEAGILGCDLTPAQITRGKWQWAEVVRITLRSYPDCVKAECWDPEAVQQVKDGGYQDYPDRS